jgi:predicted nucleotidyltransferase
MFNFDNYQNEIESVCRKYQVKSLGAFGSALSDDFNENSDIDFLIELDSAKNGVVRYMNVKFELEALLKCSVDLVMPKAIKNNLIKNYILSEVRNLYAA